MADIVDPSTSTLDPAQSTLSPNFAQYVYNMLGRGEAAASQPFQEYTGQRFAGASPLQQQAFGGLSSLVGGGGYGGYGGFGGIGGFMPSMQTPPRSKALSVGEAPSQAGDIDIGQEAQLGDQQMGTPSIGFGAQPNAPWQYGVGSALAAQAGLGSFTRPKTATAFMSPYMQNVVDVQQQEAQRQADIANQAQKAQFAKAGAFGGGRFAIQQAQAAADLARQKQNIQATGLQSAYQQAQQQYNAERDAQLRAAMGLGQLGGSQFGTQLSGLQALAGMGGTQQQLMQQPYDFGYQQWQQSLQYPYQQATFMQSLLGGLPLQATPYNMGQTGMASALQGGLAGLSLYNLFNKP